MASVRASYLLIPMDMGQSNHLKAYGIAYYAVAGEIEMSWLLNYRGGSFIALYEESKQWDKIGFQTVYRGGNAVSESPITWYTIKTTAIDSAVTNSDILTEDCYDLQGRRVAPNTRGLIITSKGKRINK